MRYSFIILLFLSLSAQSATYYVAATGNNGNAGTIGSPWLTWEYALEHVSAGDVIYVRGGVYAGTALVADGTAQGATLDGSGSAVVLNVHGSFGNLITIQNYPGERPIYDMTGLTLSNRMKGFIIRGCSYLHIKGLEFTKATQTGSYIAVGFWAESITDCIIEQVKSYGNQGSGFYMLASSGGNLILNCDWYNNYDPATSGGNADGMNICRITNSTFTNTVRGCRAYHNGDDGFDFVLNPGYVNCDHNWSYNNGINSGNGNGFKLGENDGTPTGSYQRTVTNCLAFHNKASGFSQNEATIKMALYNNTAYHNHNLGGFYFGWVNTADVFRNNAALDNTGENYVHAGSPSIATSDHNSWNGTVTITAVDFVSIDSSGVSGARGISGQLPSVNFLKLTAGSDLIDAGVSVGISYSGTAPDLGAFEYATTSNVTGIIVKQSGKVIKQNGKIIKQ